jgi:hypothetical protein
MKPAAVRAEIVNTIAVNAIWIAILIFFFAVGPVLADEGIVERADVCHKGSIIIKTTDDVYVAAIQAGLDDVDQTPWSDDSEPKCSFFAGERVHGDLSGAGTVTLTNSSGRACDYLIQGSGTSLQDAEQALGCE